MSLDGRPVVDQSRLPPERIGGENSTSKLDAVGCVLSSFTMALSHISGVDRDPVQLNRELVAAGAFANDGASLNLESAAQAAGVEVSRKIEMWEPGAVSVIDTALENGEAVLLRVDHKGDPGGDHTVLITGKNADGTYRGIDPAGGYEVTMVEDADGNLVGRGWREYTATDFRVISDRVDEQIAP